MIRLFHAAPLVVIALFINGCGRVATQRMAINNMNAYNAKARYKQGQALAFPDFSLRYEGQTRVVPKFYPQGLTTYNFVVTQNDKTQPLKWSSGTGLIAPQEFAVGGDKFLLELQRSDIAGQLKADELIIWRESDWNARQTKPAR